VLLTIQPSTARGDEGRKVCPQVVCCLLGLLGHLDCTPVGLPVGCEQRLHGAEAEARQTVLKLHDKQVDGLVLQERHALRALSWMPDPTSVTTLAT
jgi:hypothetical protein